MKPWRFAAAAARIAAAIIFTHAAFAGAAEIRVLCSTGMSAAMAVLVPEFERSSGHKLSIAYDTTNLLMGRIKGGESADLVILIASVIDDLAKQGKVVGRADLARSGVGISVRAGAPKPDIRTVDALKRALVNAKSIAYTTTGASGIYFSGLIERLGIAEQVKAKAKVSPGGAVGALLVKGEAEMAVQQIPELMSVAGTELVGPLPPEVQYFTVFSAGVFTGAKQGAAAQALIKFLSTPEAARVYKSKGMEPG